MFESTTEENFRSWDKFLDSYYQAIRTSVSLLPFIGESSADDVTQSFFLKFYEKDFLANRPVITGRFRNWLYVAARRHAVDEWRKIRRTSDHLDLFEIREPDDRAQNDPHAVSFESDELYALSVLHLAVRRVREQLVVQGKSECWKIFEELVVASLFPGREPMTRHELLVMFPGQSATVLDNRVTTVKRVLRRVLAAVVPADPTEQLTAEERFRELLGILAESKSCKLWLAFLTDPAPDMDLSSGSSLKIEDAAQEMLNDELGILLGFWLNMPLCEYLDDLESIGPLSVRGPRRRAEITLRDVISEADPQFAELPSEDKAALYKLIKEFAKRVYRSIKRTGDEPGRATTSMPVEVANVVYNLAGALALTRNGMRIIGLSDDQFRKNLSWVLERPWVDTALRPVLSAAIDQLKPSSNS